MLKTSCLSSIKDNNLTQNPLRVYLIRLPKEAIYAHTFMRAFERKYSRQQVDFRQIFSLALRRHGAGRGLFPVLFFSLTKELISNQPDLVSSELTSVFDPLPLHKRLYVRVYVDKITARNGYFLVAISSARLPLYSQAYRNLAVGSRVLLPVSR